MTRNQIVELYSATFNRAADADGVAYWETQTNLTQEQMANSFVISAEAVALYPTTQTNTEYVTAIYNNLFGRAPEADGLAYWVGKLDDGTDKKESMIAAFINGASPADKAVLDNKTAVSLYAVDSGSNTTTVSLSSVTADAATVTAAITAVNEANPDFGETFVLTTGSDSFVGTAKNDLFTSANGTLAANDTILDSSTTDHDILNIETTSTTGVAARIQNVETINANGTYVAVGYDASNTAGTQTLNMSTSIVGGTATAKDVSSINVANVVAGTNISTLNVDSAAGGTRDTVNVDAGSASAVNITGDANGIDKFNVTIADGATLTVTDLGSLGEYTANVGATATITTVTGTGIKTFTVNADADSTVTVNNVLTDTAANLGNTDFTGAGNVRVETLVANVDAQAMTSTGTGTLTVEVTDDAVGTNLKDIQADTVELSAVQTGAVTVNANSTVILNDTTANGTSVVTLNVENAGTTTMTAGTGTLNLKVAENQATVTTGANVQTLLVEATPDAAIDTDGTNGDEITVASLVTNAATETVVVSGSADLGITQLTDAANLVVTATQMTGKLTVGAATVATNDITLIGGTNDDTLAVNIATGKEGIVLGGAGNDTIAATGAGTAVIKLYGEAGDDTITGAAVASILDGGAGNDTITGGAAADTIVGGTGNDIINGAGGADAITLGAGTDTVIIAAGEGDDVISDFVVGEDKIILRGAADNAAALDVTALTVSSGNYAAKLGAAHAFTLTGSTATDLNSAIQFGDSTTAYAIAANYDFTAGSLNDVVTTGATSGDINLGAGDDKITVTAATTGELTGGAGSDTFVIGAAAAIVDFGATDILQVSAGVVAVDVVEDFTATAATTNAAATTTLTLADGVDVDMTLATLSAVTNGYTIATDATLGVVTVGATITGSRGNDTITGSKFADTITGGEGADDITGGAGNDTIILTESVSAIDTITVTVVDDGIDTLVDFGTNDVVTMGGAAVAGYVDETSTGTDVDYSASVDLDAAIAAAYTDDQATAFEYAGKTYVVVDADDVDGYTEAGDYVVELVGVSAADLGAANFEIA